MDLQNLQTLFMMHFNMVKASTQTLTTNVINQLYDTSTFLTNNFYQISDNVQTYPYQDTFNTYVNLSTEFVENHWILLSFIFCFMVLSMLTIILLRQWRMINQLKNTEAIDLLNLRTKLQILQENNQTLEQKLIQKDNQLAFYRKLRSGMSGGFCKVAGSQSNREFRGVMRSIGGEYLGKGIYLVRMKYANRFDKQKVTL